MCGGLWGAARCGLGARLTDPWVRELSSNGILIRGTTDSIDSVCAGSSGGRTPSLRVVVGYRINRDTR